MTVWDAIYKDLVQNILKNGTMQSGNVRAKYADGRPAYTKYLKSISFELKPEDGIGVLTSKFVGTKWAFMEMEWIWQQRSNDVSWLNDRNVTIWDEWKQEDGTIGKAYGWQLENKKRKSSSGEHLNQVHYVIDQLLNNPSSRRIRTSLWGVEDLDKMALEPCVYDTTWSVNDDNTLDLQVKQRSADVALGLPYNVVQYGALHRLMAETVNLNLGTMYWHIDNAHIYDRHLKTIEKQVSASLRNEENIFSLELPLGLNNKTIYESFDSKRLSEAKVCEYNKSQTNGIFRYEVAE